MSADRTADQGYPFGVVILLVYLLSRGLVTMYARLVERQSRRDHREENGGDGGRGGGNGGELVLAA